MTENSNANRASDHLANERTFLAWVRTGAAIVVFGFAIGRFSIAMRQLTALQGHAVKSVGLSVIMGSFTIVAGVALVVAGLVRYRRTRAQLNSGTFEPAGFVVGSDHGPDGTAGFGAGGIFDLYGEDSSIRASGIA